MVFEHGKGLLIQGSAPVLNHVTLRNHLGPAIEIDLAAAPSGVGLAASGNLLNGIALPPGDITVDRHWGLRGIPYVLQAGTRLLAAQGGGTIIESMRTPLQNPDFSPFLQRIKDAKPEAVFICLPAGEPGILPAKGRVSYPIREALRQLAAGA